MDANCLEANYQAYSSIPGWLHIHFSLYNLLVILEKKIVNKKVFAFLQRVAQFFAHIQYNLEMFLQQN